MAEKKVMSAQITLLPTMCPSTVWCRRGDWTIVPLSGVPPPPRRACVHLRLPLFIHGDTWAR